MPGGPPRKNFWLWGIWGRRIIKKPFLTQKVDAKIRNIVIGNSFIIALQEDGSLVSWGEDKGGCLGLGSEKHSCPEPQRIQNITGKVIDVQYGAHHVLALTNKGQVWAWGQNDNGQLGAGDTGSRFEPVVVESLDGEAVVQILAFQSSSFALTKNGTVYAWGKNQDGELALETENPRVFRPEPMISLRDQPVNKLEIKGKTIIAYVDLAPELTGEDQVGGFNESLGAPKDGALAKGGLADDEREVFEGVNLMRKVYDNTQEWWIYLLDIRHGMPYEDNPTQKDPETDPKGAEDGCSALQLDMHVSVEKLEEAKYEIDKLIRSAKAQIVEIRHKRGTKNVNFMLSMFIDDCKLRAEKISRTIESRKLMDLKRAAAQNPPVMVSDMKKDSEVKRLNQANDQLQRTLQDVRRRPTYDVFTRELQQSLVETIESKLQVHETQIECIKAGKKQADPINAPLRTIKERWGALKHFSIFNLYQECILRGQKYNFGSDDEMLAWLVKHSDSRIDQIIHIDKDQMVSRDSMVPALCYELLVENAELRKMCNTYQLKVLLMKNQKGGAKAAT